MEQYCIYLRKSRADIEAESRGEGETLARHQATLVELAKRQQLNVVRIYKEIVSGDSIAARPQMQMLLSDITEKIYAGVLVVEIERLARGDTIDQGIVAQAFKESNTKIITPIKTYDPSNEFDEEYFEFGLFMSRREYKTIKRRMNAGRIASVKEGNYICSRTPYGYKKVSPEPKIHTLEIVPEEAEVIRMIYKMYLDGKGSRAIAGELNRIGIKPQKNEYWENPSIKKILSNPLYCGKIVWSTKSKNPILCDGLHEAIIPKEIFQSVQEKKKNNPVAQLHPNDKLLNYYHNILYCKNCGHQMKRRYVAETGLEHVLCRYRQCVGIVVGASLQSVDEAVITAFYYRIIELEEMIKQGQTQKPTLIPDKKKPLLLELAKSKQQQNKLYDLLEQGIYDSETFLSRSSLLSEKIRAIESQLKEIEESENKVQKSPELAIIELKYVINNFDKAEAGEKNRLLKRVVRKIYYSKTQRMCKNKSDTDLTLEIDFL